MSESRLPGETAGALAERLAREKARDVGLRLPGGTPSVVLAADTVVTVGRYVFGKPADPVEATRMLRMLSGRAHRVVTGVAVRSPGGSVRSARSTTRVVFRRLSREEIRRYAISREPLGKAGAYAIQGAAGLFVTSIRGSYTNIVGLPLELVVRLLGVPR